MPDQREEFDRLGMYWNAVVRGEPAVAGDLDPALVEALRRFQQLGTSPTPPGAHERVWGTVVERGRTRAHRTELDMDGAYRLNARLAGLGDNGHGDRSSRAASTTWWRTGPRWVGLQLAAAVLLFALGVGYAWFGPDRQSADRPIAILAPESSDLTPAAAMAPRDGETLLDLTLADFEPFRAEGGLAVTEYPPNGYSTELAGVMSPEVLFIETGPMDATIVKAPTPIQRFDPSGLGRSSPDALLEEGQEATLETGTTLMLPAGAVIDLRNSGASLTRMIDLLWASESYSTEHDGARWDRVWGQPFPYIAPPTSLALRRMTLAPGAFLPDGSWPAALDSAQQRYLRAQEDGSVRNTGTEPVDVYVLIVTSAATEPTTEQTALAPLWQSTGGTEPMVNPYGLGVDPSGNVWAADRGDRFQIVSPGGTFRETWGASGSGNGEFAFLSTEASVLRAYGDVAFDAAGNAYVADTGNHRVQKFAPDRTFLAAWGSKGTADGQFMVPSGIAAGPNGDVYVSDEVRGDVQRFDADGRFLDAIGTYGTGDGQFVTPAGVAVADDGSVWVADYGNHRIQHFAADGAWIAAWGGLGSGDGELSNPNDVAVDDAGRVYVADDGHARLQVFTADGTFLAKIGDVGPESDRFYEAVAVAVGADGLAFVSDLDRIRAVRLGHP